MKCSLISMNTRLLNILPFRKKSFINLWTKYLILMSTAYIKYNEFEITPVKVWHILNIWYSYETHYSLIHTPSIIVYIQAGIKKLIHSEDTNIQQWEAFPLSLLNTHLHKSRQIKPAILLFTHYEIKRFLPSRKYEHVAKQVTNHHLIDVRNWNL